MRTIAAAFRLQLQIVRRNPDYLMNLATVPIFTSIFLSIVRNAGRDDLIGFAVMGPVLMGLWGISLFIAGEIIVTDRFAGILEGVVAAPAPFPFTVVGRVYAVTSVGLISFVEAWLVARFGFGVDVPIHHPFLFLAAVLVTSAAMSGTALLMAAVFALGRRSRPFQRALNYPFYVLGGVLVPVAFLPEWIRPVSRAIFLSWSSDLLRATLQRAPVVNPLLRLTVIAILGLAAFLAGWWLTRVILKRVRRLGTMTYV